jgi:ATPase subunit of ABC transporter with duplicated ATPase domains
MFVETINTLGTLTNAYDIGKKSQPLLGKLVRRIREQKLNIVICGDGGTGKSTLGRLLSGEFGRQDILQPYQISFRSEKLELDSKTSTSVLVLPGQSEFWGEELKKIANNRSKQFFPCIFFCFITHREFQRCQRRNDGSSF